MQMGGKLGSKLLNDALIELVQAGKVDANEAYIKCVVKDDFLKQCRAAGIKVNAPGAEQADDPAGGGLPHGSPRPTAGASPRPALPSSPPSAAPGARPTPPRSVTGAPQAPNFFDKFKRP
jgi:hypothetical protein